MVRESLEFVDQQFANLEPGMRRKALVHRLLDVQVVDQLQTLNESLAELDFKNAEEVMASEFLVEPSQELQHKKKELEKFLYQNVYRHERLIAMRSKAQHRIQQLYGIYVASPEEFPGKHLSRLEKIGERRMAGEYIAGMTDRFFEQTFERITEDQVRG